MFGQRRDDPGVAAVLFGAMKFTSREPNDRVPPKDDGNREFDDANDVITTAVVSEFMNDQGIDG